jgi:Fe-S-cluster containining protein
MEPPLDRTLLNGFSFACRPGCGLCCYAGPAASTAERTALLRIEPGVPFLPEGGGFATLATRPNGGACVLLQENRCRHHDQRPFPCRAFPIVVHVGRRAQATLVLSCPGLDLSPLDRWAEGPPGPGRPPEGLASELAAVENELRSAPVDRWIRSATRAERNLLGASATEAAGMPPVRWKELRTLEGTPPPPVGTSPDELPLFSDPREGVVALASTAEGAYALARLSEAGAAPEPLAEVLPPRRPPSLTEEGERRLRGYSHYLASRDHFLWSGYHERFSGAHEPIGAILERNLSEARSEVLVRAVVRARWAGRTGERLDAEEVSDGIRAFDAELLDRPTLGRIL